MSKTYTRLYIHFVFGVKYRRPLIPPDKKNHLHRYITGVCEKRGAKMLAVHAMPEHVHIFLGIPPDRPINELIRDIKAHSSSYINKNGWCRRKFKWQEGFGAFSHSRSQIDRVIKYIHNQVEIHRKRSFDKEYMEFLEKFDISPDRHDKRGAPEGAERGRVF